MDKPNEAAANYELERSARHDANATELPWHCKRLIGVVERGFALFRTKESGTAKTTHRIDVNGEFSKEDAEFIVRAVNAHDALVRIAELLKMMDEKEGLSPTALGWFRDAAIAALEEAGVT